MYELFIQRSHEALISVVLIVCSRDNRRIHTAFWKNFHVIFQTQEYNILLFRWNHDSPLIHKNESESASNVNHGYIRYMEFFKNQIRWWSLTAHKQQSLHHFFICYDWIIPDPTQPTPTTTAAHSSIYSICQTAKYRVFISFLSMINTRWTVDSLVHALRSLVLRCDQHCIFGRWLHR